MGNKCKDDLVKRKFLITIMMLFFIIYCISKTTARGDLQLTADFLGSGQKVIKDNIEVGGLNWLYEAEPASPEPIVDSTAVEDVPDLSDTVSVAPDDDTSAVKDVPSSVASSSSGVLNLTGTGENNKVVLKWDLPDNPDVKSVRIVRSCVVDGLVAGWSMDEGSGNKIYDTFGNCDTGKIFGATWDSGKIGSGLRFDGIDDYVIVPNSPDITLSTTGTIEAWVKPENKGSVIVAKGGGDWNGYGYKLAINPYWAIFGFMWTGGWYANTVWSGYFYGKPWHHVVGVADGTKLHLYVNGVEEGSEDIRWGGDLSGILNNLMIGRNESGSEVFKGVIDEVKIYNRGLSWEEVLVNCGGPKIWDVAGTTSVWTDTELVGNGIYNYCISTYDDAMNCTGTQSIDVEAMDTIAPNAPANFKGDVDRYGRKVTLSWTNPADGDFAGVKISRQSCVETDPCVCTLLGEHGGSPLRTTFTDTTLVGETDYTYTIQSYDEALNYSSTASIQISIGDITPPGPITSLNVAKNLDGCVEFNWTNPSDLDLAGVRIDKVELDTASGLMAYFTMDEGSGTTTVDEMNGNVGTVMGAVWDTGYVDSCLRFNGDGYVKINDSERLDSVDGEVTVSAWIKLGGYTYGGAYQGAICSKGGGWNRAGWLLTVTYSGNVRWHLGSGSSEKWTDNGNIQLGRWYHIVGMLRQGKMYTYINDIEQPGIADWSNVYVNDYPLLFGEAGNSSTWFNGLIDEVKIYNRGLAKQEIKNSEEISVGLGTSFRDYNVKNGMKYTYTLFSYDEVPNYSSGVRLGITTPTNSLDVSNLKLIAGDRKIELNWENPQADEFAGIRISRESCVGADPCVCPLLGEHMGSPLQTSFTDTGLTNNMSYTYLFSSKDTSGVYYDPVVRQCMPYDSTPPGDITDLGVSTSDGRVKLKWTNPGDWDLAGVRISRESQVIYDGQTTSFADYNVCGGLSYEYKLCAYDDEVPPNYSNGVRVAVNVSDTTCPGVVTNLTAVSGDEETIKLNWQNPTNKDLAGIKILRGVYNTSKVFYVNDTTFMDTGLVSGIDYSYSLLSFDYVPNYSDSVSICASAKDVISPSDVSNFNAVGADGKVFLSWVNPTDVDFAGIRVSRLGTDTPLTRQLANLQTSFTDTTVTNGITYTYTIQAYDEVPNYSSGATAVVSTYDVTPPGVVTNLSATAGVEQTITLNWVNPADADFAGTKIVRSSSVPSDSSQVIFKGGTTSYLNSNLVQGREYTYSVSTYDSLLNYSSVVVVSCRAQDIVPPGAVWNFNGSVDRYGRKVSLSWCRPLGGDFAGIQLTRATNDEQQTTICNGWAWYFTDTALAEDTDYTYTIQAYDEVPNYSSTASIQINIGDITPPGPITNLNVVKNLDGCVELSWQNPGDSDLCGIKISRGEVSLPNNVGAVREPPLQTVYGGLVTSFRDTNLQNGVTYTYTIHAYDEVPNYSQVVKVETTPQGNPYDTTPPGEITNLTISASDGKVELTWTNPSFGPDDYDFEGVEISRTNPIVNETASYWGMNERFGGTIVDVVSRNNGQIIGATWDSGYIGSGLRFDGNDDYVNINSVNPFRNNFTVSAWVKFDAINKGSDNAIIGNGQGWYCNSLHIGERGSRAYFGFIHYNDIAGTTVFTVDKWYHVAFVYDGGKKIYVNGLLDASGQSCKYESPLLNTEIGRYPWSTGNLFRGLIDEVKIFSRALTSDEIKREHDGKFELVYKGLVENHIDVNVTNGCGYTYRLRAYDKMFNYSTGVTGNALPWEYNPPSSVSEFKADGMDSGVYLTWKNPADADLMSVEISRESSVIYEGLAECYLDTAADRCKTLSYRAVCYDSLLNYSDTAGAEFSGRFTDITEFSSAGVQASAVNFVDIDNDSDLDFIFLDGAGRNHFYKNAGGIFGDNTDSSITTGYEASPGDLDSDCDIDLFVPNGTCYYGLSCCDYVYRNNGGAMFSETTLLRDYGEGASKSLFADIDLDSDLDVLILGSNRLYLNDGKGGFTRVKASDRGITTTAGCGAFTDYDKDGDIDLAVNVSGLNLGLKLYSNHGGYFTDVAKEAGFEDFSPCGLYSNSVAFADFNNDCYPDLFAAADCSNFMKVYVGAGLAPAREVTSEIGLGGVSSVNDIALGDLDNDGDLDLVLGSKTIRNRIYENRQGLFTDATEKYGIGSANKDCNQVKLVDIDKDGDMDIYFANSEGGILLRNNIDNTNFLEIDLRCKTSNRFGIGAKISLNGSSGLNRYEEVSEPRPVHFGLGELDSVDVKVVFPSGFEVVQKGVAAGQFLTIDEPYYIAPVTDFSAVGSDMRIDLSWKNPESLDFSGTKIIRDTKPLAGLPIDQMTGVEVYDSTDTAFIDTCVTNDVVYYYAAFSYDTTGACSLPGVSNYISAVPHDYIAPSPVTGVMVKAGVGHITLRWMNPTDADFAGIKISRQSCVGTDPCVCSLLGEDGGSPLQTTFTDTAATNGITYTYTIQAYDEVPNYSSEVTVSSTPAIFENVAGLTILETQDKGVNRAVAFDYDNDGLEDLFLACTGRDYLYRNKVAIKDWELVSGPWDTTSDDSQGVSAGDLNNDGRTDLFVCNSGQPSVLYLNTDSGFAEAWSSDVGYSMSAALFDMDNDNDLDIYVVSRYGENRMYENRSTNVPAYQSPVFVDVTKMAGLGYDGCGVKAAVFDYDRDGDRDLYLVNYISSNVLYENDGTGKFRDVTGNVGLTDNGHSQDAVVFDYNNDGWKDLYVVNWWENNKLYENQRRATSDERRVFRDVAQDLGLTWRERDISVVSFDMDRDGDKDLCVGNWWGESRIYENRSERQSQVFKEIIQGEGKVSSIVKIDFDNDGDEDLYFVNWEGDNILWENLDELGERAVIAPEPDVIPPPTNLPTPTLPDTIPPESVANSQMKIGNSKLSLLWQNPVEAIRGVKIIRRTDCYAEQYNVKTMVYDSLGDNYVDHNIANETTYYYSIFSYDSSFNYSEPVKISGAPDGIFPSIKIEGVVDGKYYSTAVCPSIEVTDANLKECKITLNDSVYVSKTEIKSDKKYKLLVSAYDSADNESYESVNFVIDKTKPSITIRGVENNSYYSTDVWFKVSIAESNPVREVITLDGNVCLENETVWVRDEGAHKLVVDALDMVGYLSLKEYTFTINKESPSPPVVAPPPVVVPPQLNVTTNPDGAAVYLDGDYSYQGEIKDVSFGKHLVTVKKPGYVDYRELINFNYGEVVERNIDLVLCRKEYFYEGQLLPLDLGNVSLRPWVVDYNQDGKKDLAVRTSDGKEYLYLLNEEGQWSRDVGTQNFEPLLFNVYYAIGQGLKVKVEGRSDGKIYFDSSALLVNGVLVDVGGHSWPFIFDFDHDGNDDLISGAQNGNVYLFRNIGTVEAPTFDSAELVQANSQNLDVGTYSRPFVVDWNDDNLYDLLVGSSNGLSIYFGEEARPPPPPPIVADSTVLDTAFVDTTVAVDTSIVVDSSVVVDTSSVAVDTSIAIEPSLNLMCKTGTSASVLLEWDKNDDSNIIGHNVYRDGKKINRSLVAKNYYRDINLIDGQKYCYSVRAEDIDGGEGDDLGPIEVIPDDTGPPGPPTDLVIDLNGRLSWQKPQDFDLAGYYLVGAGSKPAQDIGACCSYQLNNLVPGVQYRFALTSYDGYRKESELSNWVEYSFSDAGVPAVPSGLKIRSAGKSGQLKVKWHQNSEPDIKGYKVYYGAESPIVVDENRLVLTGLDDFKKYLVCVSAVDTNGNESEKCEQLIGIPRSSGRFISRPEDVVVATGNKSVRLNWSPIDEADGYKVYFGTTEDLLSSPLIRHGTTAILNNLENHKRYYLALAGYKGRDEGERFLSSIVLDDAIPPNTPRDLTYVAGFDGSSLVLSWSLNRESDLSGYYVSYKTKDTYFIPLKSIGKVTRYDITGLDEDTEYVVVLYASDRDDNLSNPAIVRCETSKDAAEVKAGPPPALFLNASCENGRIRLRWEKPFEDAQYYNIYRLETGEDKYERISSTKYLKYENRAVEHGKTYCYAVTAVSLDYYPKESLFSNEVVVKAAKLAGDVEMEDQPPVQNRVDGYDLIVLSISFGSGIGDDYYNPNADLNGDGIIDGIDLDILAENFGERYEEK